MKPSLRKLFQTVLHEEKKGVERKGSDQCYLVLVGFNLTRLQYLIRITSGLGEGLREKTIGGLIPPVPSCHRCLLLVSSVLAWYGGMGWEYNGTAMCACCLLGTN